MSESPYLEILSTTAKPVSLGELWQQQPLVVALVRHFGCPFCHEQISDLETVQCRLQQLGMRVIVLGNGNPTDAASFQSKHPSFEVFTDPSRRVYRLLGMKHTVFGTIGPEATRHLLRAWRSGFRFSGVRGDAWQQGGVALFVAGRVEYVERLATAGQKLDLQRLVRAAQRWSSTVPVAANVKATG